MAEGLILKSASYEPGPGGDDAREEKLEQVMENAGFEVVEPEVPAGPEGDSGKEPRKGSRRERAIERATAPLLEKIKQLEAGQPQRAAQAEAVAPRPKPQRGFFPTDEQYEDALVKWGNEKFAAEEGLRRNLQNYGAQVKEAKNRYEDWDETVNQEIFIGKGAQLAILELPENAAEVIYYLGKNPRYAAKLGEMSEHSAIMEVGRLSQRLDRTGARASREADGEEQPKPKPKVPAPVRTVSTGGSSTAQTFAEIAAKPNYPGKAKDLKRAAAER